MIHTSSRTYDFVPLGAGVSRAPARSHETVAGEAGRITCRLETLTPIFTPALKFTERPIPNNNRPHKIRAFARREGQPVIPGSSLKGVVRSIVEAAFDGCLVLFNDVYRTTKTFPGGRKPGDAEAYRQGHPASQVVDDGRVLHVTTDYQRFLPSAFRPCRSNDSLCISCRIFGSLQGGNAYLGNVNIGDATTRWGEYTLQAPITLPMLDQPKPRDEDRYLAADRKRIAGRKFYFHSRRPITPGQRTHLTSTVEPLTGTFHFTVDYANLAPVELDALLYGIFLEPGLAHKLGMGKPLGLGSVRISPESILPYPNPVARYTTLAAQPTIRTGPEMEDWLTSRRVNLPDTHQRAKLREIWAWQEEV